MTKLTKYLPLLLVVVISFFTYFYRYWEPSRPFWDEVYHIATANRYLNQVHFFELHPPLGKLLIAAGEYLTGANQRTDLYLEMERVPADAQLSFVGYRLFPAFFGWMSAIVVYLILFHLTGSGIQALLLSSLYLFDTASIVQFRGAMLDSLQYFLVAGCILTFLKFENAPDKKKAFIFGALFGCAMAVKLTSLVLVILPLFTYFRRRDIPKFTLFCLLGFMTFYVGAWQIHFSVGEKVLPSLPRDGFFVENEDYRQSVVSGQSQSILSFPRNWYMYHFVYLPKYNESTPKLNLCRAKEKGSSPATWFFGGRAVNFLWIHVKDDINRYLYIQANPGSWGFGLVGLVVALSLGLSSLLVGYPLPHRRTLFGLLALHLGYFVGVSAVGRVMYLYHYLIPLLVSYILLAYCLRAVKFLGPLKIEQKHRTLISGVVAAGAFMGFSYYAPLAYFMPISNAEIESRAILSQWDLHCAGCERTSQVAQPVGEERRKLLRFEYLRLGGLSPHAGSQTIGEPRYGKSATNQSISIEGQMYTKAFGVHAPSSLVYSLDKQYSRFAVSVGLPDYLLSHPLRHQGASVVFEIIVNGNLAWRSSTIKPGEKPQSVIVDIRGASELELRVSDGGDGNNLDHAVWLNPKLEKLN